MLQGCASCACIIRTVRPATQSRECFLNLVAQQFCFLELLLGTFRPDLDVLNGENLNFARCGHLPAHSGQALPACSSALLFVSKPSTEIRGEIKNILGVGSDFSTDFSSPVSLGRGTFSCSLVIMPAKVNAYSLYWR